MSEEEKDQKSSFRVTDRRHFTAEGQARPEETVSEDSTASGDGSGAGSPAGSDRAADRRPEPPSPPPGSSAAGGKKQQSAPPIDFASFVLSLATTAMVHLGEVPDPVAGKPQENLAAARQMVDLLTMLQEKTEGNRTAEENRLMDEILYELRMKVLAKSKAIHL